MNLLLALFTAYVCSSAMMPTLIAAARHRGIMDEPNARKIHQVAVPLLGGVGIFASFILATTFFGAIYFESRYLFLITSLLMVFFIGLFDDFRPLSPSFKLFGQFVAAFLVAAYADVRLISWYGLFGMHEMSYLASLLVTSLLLVFALNAFNFMDGMDGFASSFAVIVAVFQGALFYIGGLHFFALLSFILVGAIAGFLRFNNAPARIFMGDTGSMVIGWLLAVSSVQLSHVQFTGYDLPEFVAVPIATSLMIIPVADALRVVFLRLFAGHSPFRPDNQHFHHELLRSGFSPRRSILLLIGMQLFILWLTLTIIRLPFTQILCLQIISTLLLLFLPVVIVNYRKQVHQQG